MASRSQSKRDFELKLLKHAGVCNLLIFEALSFHFRQHLSDGRPVKNSKEILPLLESKILLLLGVSPADGSASESSKEDLLKSRCSKSVSDRIIQLIERVIDHASSDSLKGKTNSLALTPDGCIEIKGLIESEMRLIFHLMEWAITASNGDIFAKPRINFISQLIPDGAFPDAYLLKAGLTFSSDRLDRRPHAWPLFQIPRPQLKGLKGNLKTEAQAGGEALSLFQSLQALQPLIEAGFKISYNGQPLQELTNEEFTTQLNLNESSLNQSNSIAQNQSIQWFDLHPQFFLHGKEISGDQVGQMVREGIIEHEGKFYLIPTRRLPTLRKLSSFWERLAKGKRTKTGKNALAEQVFQVPKSQILEMLALRKSGVSVVGGERWKQICHFYDNLGNTQRAVFEIPKSVRAILKPYQIQGAQWLYELWHLGLGGLLADDMGLGKTLQTLSFWEKLRSENRLGSVLLIVPTSLTYNWLSESKRFTPELPMQAFSPKAKDQALEFRKQNPHSVLVTTYGLMIEHKEFFQNQNWDMLTFDEAQNLKNIAAQRTSVARSLSATTKLCLTGTPLENHLGEFYSLLDLAVPGSLGELDEFRQVFVQAPSINSEDMSFLKLKVKPLVLRRTKQQILSELPEKTESRVALDFEDKQRKIYRDVALSYNNQIQTAIAEQGENKCQLQMLTALLRLRQACSDPSSLPGIKYTKTPPKLEAAAEAVQEIIESGQSVLVFTQFLNTLHRAEALFLKEGIETFVIHGGLSQSKRETVLKKFDQCNKDSVLIMTLKTGGVGLNLAKASYVIHLEPWWNPAVENQATDRAHRLGQKQSVQVYRYIMHESVEEKIEILKQRKQKTFTALFGDATEEAAEGCSHALAQLTSEQRKEAFLSQEDFKFLLS